MCWNGECMRWGNCNVLLNHLPCGFMLYIIDGWDLTASLGHTASLGSSACLGLTRPGAITVNGILVRDGRGLLAQYVFSTS